MAYRDIVDERFEDYDMMDEAGVLMAPRADAAVRVSEGFTALEDQVIRLARADGLGSIEAPGVIERLIGWLFGIRTNGRALADARLESLRRAVILAHNRHHLPDAQVIQLRECGFTPGQIGLIELRAIRG